MSVATIKLLLKDPKSEKQYSIDITIHAPELQIINCVIDDKIVGNGDDIPDPGETFNLVFKVRNQGSSDVSGQFNISSNEKDIAFVEPSIKSGTLKFGQVTDIPILVKLAEASASGSYISILSTLDCTPYIIKKDFTFRVGKIRESFEAQSFNIFPWINVSPIPWTITSANSYDGNISARSGAIPHGGSTSIFIRTLYKTADSVRFLYKVSSEQDYDFLSFKLNGVEIFKKSGETLWTKVVIAVPAGLNRLEWIYKKDNTVSKGSDCAWIDLIDFAQYSPVNYIQNDLQVARIVSPVKKDKYGKELISVNVLNLGKDILNGFTLAYSINNRFPPEIQHFDNQVIPFGDSVMVSFKSRADMTKYGIYEIVAYGLDNNDDYALNDTMRVNIENIKLAETLGVFPNPFSSILTVYINSPVDDKLHISITNVSGVKFYEVEKDILSGQNSFTLSDFNLIPSLYYINIRGATINRTIPVLKTDK